MAWSEGLDLPGAEAPHPIRNCHLYVHMWTAFDSLWLWSDFLSVGFFGKKFFGQSRKVILSFTLFYWKTCSDLIHWFRLMYQAMRSRNKEMSDTLKGQLIRKGVASLAIHRIKMQTQSCGSESWTFLWPGSSHSNWTWIQVCNHSGGFWIN